MRPTGTHEGWGVQVPFGFLRRTSPSPLTAYHELSLRDSRENSDAFADLIASARLDESLCSVISRISSAESLILLSWAFSSARADMPEEKMTAAARISIANRDLGLFIIIPPFIVFRIYTFFYTISDGNCYVKRTVICRKISGDKAVAKVMENKIFAPWRMAYILSNSGRQRTKEPGCIFCEFPK